MIKKQTTTTTTLLLNLVAYLVLTWKGSKHVIAWTRQMSTNVQKIVRLNILFSSENPIHNFNGISTLNVDIEVL